MSVVLSILSGPSGGQTYSFDKGAITLGRDPQNDVALPDDKAVSEHHARLVWERDVWAIYDAQSKNGVYLEQDGAFRRIAGSAPLAFGQRFRLGRTDFRLNPAAELRARLVVRIDLENDTLKFQTLSSGAYGARHASPYCEDDVAMLNARLRGLVLTAHRNYREGAEARGHGVVAVFEEAGHYLHDHLFPPRIQRRLLDTSGGDLFLVHDASLIRVPWELALVGNQFLCRRFNLGRQILVDDQGSVLQKAHGEQPARLLIISNPTGDLPEVQEQAEALLGQLIASGAQAAGGGVQVEFLAGPRVERVDLLSRLTKTDVVFYAGHAEYDPVNPANSGWILERGRVTCADFRGLHPPPALVFANGCESAREATWSSEPDPRSCGYGIASSFILAGVRSYLGAIWPIRVRSSAVFASEFFRGLFAGVPIGECVRRAREEVVAACGAEDTVWASYVLYGDPANRFG